MVFNSYIFILFFLPLVVSGYFLLNKYYYGKKGQVGLLWLLGLSLWFYAYDIPIYLLLFGASILVNYFLGKIISGLKLKKDIGRKQQKQMLILGIVLNLVPLLYFKYTNFLLESIKEWHITEWRLEIVLPLGISFYTFMQIAYLVDCYRDQKGYDYTLLEYATYMTFFPKIIMGPIALHSEIIPQLRDKSKKKADYHNLSCGLYAFSLGLAKKVLIADTLARFVNLGYSFEEVFYLNSATAIFVMISYTLQLYFDFSGYCDMAVGIARMMNIELPYNFNSPYKAKSISEFWERWHMTLTRFFTRYVYIPLGGSRKGKIRTYINTMIVFLLSGLWHGAEWTFIIWGLFHGTFMTAEKIGKDLGIGIKKIAGFPRKIVACFQWIVTFIIINMLWILFRAPNMIYARTFKNRIFSGGWKLEEFITENFYELIEVRIWGRFGMSGLIEACGDWFIWGVLLILVLSVALGKNTQEKMMMEKYNGLRSIITAGLLVWCIISLSSVSVFLYFNF